MKTYFVTGTGTGIGKTFSTGVLAKAASEAGARTAVMKPVQTGLERPEDGDIGCVATMAPLVLKLPSDLACPYCLKFESSPHLAAAKERIVIDFGRIRAAYDKVVADFSPDLVLLEGAGGLMVPIDEKRMMADLIGYLGFPVILTATAGLGTINHVMLSLNELERRKISVAGICINLMPSHPSEIETDNVEMIRRLSGLPVLTVISESSSLHSPVFTEVHKIW